MRRRRQLNIPRIKGVFMLAVAVLAAAGSAVTGIGAQIAATPAIAFLLGYAPEKSAGTGVAVAVFAALGSLAGFVLGGASVPLAAAVLVAVGATVGTMFAAPLGRHPRIGTVRRFAQTLGIVIGLLVLQEGIRRRIGGPVPVPLAFAAQHPYATAVLAGLATGILSASLELSTGVLLVPALIYVLGFAPVNAIGASLVVVVLAALLPAVSYHAQGLVDRGMIRWMAVGAILGGLVGGLYLSQLPPGAPVPLVGFGLIAMLLSAWRLSRAT